MQDDRKVAVLPEYRTLIEVLQAAADAGGQEYRHFVLNWLGKQIGFDGVVWGVGARDASGSVTIQGAELRGRPPGLLQDYVEVAALDPVSRRFAKDPQQLQAIDVAEAYRPAQLWPVGNYLERYRVRQLLLCGASTQRGGLSWLTLYRDDASRPFSAEEARMAAFAIPFALLAARESGQPQGLPAADCLSPRERQVAAAYAAGEGYKAIARSLGLAPATVRTHLQTIFRKLGVHNKIDLRRQFDLS
ncbi:MAG: hypothetical protein JNJ44_01390 [Zoogloeaceae bacterium]|nr:hypothetical protein [Zoogloeaceae bacterium]